MITNKFINFCISLQIFARTDFFTTIGIQGGLMHNFTGNTDGITEFAPVLFSTHIVEQNTWMFKRIFGFQANPTTRW
ncbi:Uncharacterised protein [Mycobacteroides abscessus]|nr:Uncharacterised protein [Mycobacteroides abscessus]